MPKNEKMKVNVKEKVEDNICDLSLAELTEVPVREIASFKRISTLDLSSNRLLTLGKNFHTLSRLVKLDLSKNQIKYLPDEFGLLRNLRHLDLYDNKLEHLPLSFGNLTSLRYLDLKGNPLLPAVAKIVGFCLTTKECQDSARNTVKFLARMQTEVEKAKEQLALKNANTQQTLQENVEINSEQKSNEKSKKANNKNAKSKVTKKLNSNNAEKDNRPLAKTTNDSSKITAKSKKSANGGAKKTSGKGVGGTAFTSIFIFFLLLCINVVLIYTIMFKNPEIVKKMTEYVPHQYRDWILTKTEVFRLRVTDWIAEFRTPPEEQ